MGTTRYASLVSILIAASCCLAQSSSVYLSDGDRLYHLTNDDPPQAELLGDIDQFNQQMHRLSYSSELGLIGASASPASLFSMQHESPYTAAEIHRMQDWANRGPITAIACDGTDVYVSDGIDLFVVGIGDPIEQLDLGTISGPGTLTGLTNLNADYLLGTDGAHLYMLPKAPPISAVDLGDINLYGGTMGDLALDHLGVGVGVDPFAVYSIEIQPPFTATVLSPTTGMLGVAVAICRVDLTGDHEVNTIDVLAFLGAWTLGEELADWNLDGTVNTLDFLAFLNEWVAGC